MKELTILGGSDKQGNPEKFETLSLKCGEIYTIVGNTGSGKSRLIKDIEQLVNQDSVSKRVILLDGEMIEGHQRYQIANELIAHLSQNMRFVLDITVREFLELHCACRNKKINLEKVIEVANQITREPIQLDYNLNLLSGGQTRALMIADIGCVCDSPIVLIDEIENAGIDKINALKLLSKQGKLVLIVTHDVHTALMAKKRIVMEHGAVVAVVEKSEAEEHLFLELESSYERQQIYQMAMRKGEEIK